MDSAIALSYLPVTAPKHSPNPTYDAARTVEIGRFELALAAWRIGPCRLLAAPVELFQELGLALRRRVGGPLILATNANGSTGYWPTAEAFEEGGYEVEPSGPARGDGERLVEELVALAEALA